MFDRPHLDCRPAHISLSLPKSTRQADALSIKSPSAKSATESEISLPVHKLAVSLENLDFGRCAAQECVLLQLELSSQSGLALRVSVKCEDRGLVCRYVEELKEDGNIHGEKEQHQEEAESLPTGQEGGFPLKVSATEEQDAHTPNTPGRESRSRDDIRAVEQENQQFFRVRGVEDSSPGSNTLFVHDEVVLSCKPQSAQSDEGVAKMQVHRPTTIDIHQLSQSQSLSDSGRVMGRGSQRGASQGGTGSVRGCSQDATGNDSDAELGGEVSQDSMSFGEGGRVTSPGSVRVRGVRWNCDIRGGGGVGICAGEVGCEREKGRGAGSKKCDMDGIDTLTGNLAGPTEYLRRGDLLQRVGRDSDGHVGRDIEMSSAGTSATKGVLQGYGGNRYNLIDSDLASSPMGMLERAVSGFGNAWAMSPASVSNDEVDFLNVSFETGDKQKQKDLGEGAEGNCVAESGRVNDDDDEDDDCKTQWNLRKGFVLHFMPAERRLMTFEFRPRKMTVEGIVHRGIVSIAIDLGRCLGDIRCLVALHYLLTTKRVMMCVICQAEMTVL